MSFARFLVVGRDQVEKESRVRKLVLKMDMSLDGLRHFWGTEVRFAPFRCPGVERHRTA
jgi:hypothetical protein